MDATLMLLLAFWLVGFYESVARSYNTFLVVKTRMNSKINGLKITLRCHFFHFIDTKCDRASRECR